MEHFPLPVHRKEFSFRSVLFVDPGNGILHPRASVDRLIVLLYANNPPILEDEPGHFYAAQLKHYGLPFTKKKTDAKARLMEVLNTNTLVVPKKILEMEEDMRAEWESDYHREKAYVERRAALSQPGKEDTSEERAANNSDGAEGPGTIRICLHKHELMRSAVESPPLYRWSDDVVEVSAKYFERQSKAGTANTTSTPKKVSGNNVTSASDIKSASQATPRRDSKDAENASQLQRVSNEPTTDKTSAYAYQGSHVLLAGKYQCMIGGACVGMFGSDTFDLTLSFDYPRGVWWATFQLGPWEGILQMNPGPMTADDVHFGRAFSFNWQLRDLMEAKVVFGKHCTGQMTGNWREEISVSMFGIPGVFGIGLLEFDGVKVYNSPPYYDDMQQA